MGFRIKVSHACLSAVLIFAAFGAAAEERREPKVTTNLASGCPDYCGDSKCNTIQHEVVCSEDDAPTQLYWETCASISSYYQAGSKCCTKRLRCCTYYDRNGDPRTRWEDEGETLSCG